jgi:hypothetical protein
MPCLLSCRINLLCRRVLGIVLPGHFKTMLKKDKFFYICKVILKATPVFQDNHFTELITAYNLALCIFNQRGIGF